MTDTAHAYDVFLSFSQIDQGWAWNWLIPRLKASGLSLCIAAASGDPAITSLNQPDLAVSASRYQLLVLTPGWVASEWERLAGALAPGKPPQVDRRHTIALFRQPCKPGRELAGLAYVDFSDGQTVEAQFARLLDVLQGRSRRADLGAPLGSLLELAVPTNFLFQRHENFLDRADLLAELRERLDSRPAGPEASPDGEDAGRPASPLAILSGPAGAGKSQLAVEYVFRYGDAFPGGVFWINGAASLAEGLAWAGHQIIDNAAGQPLRPLVKAVIRYLQRTPDTLLVVDGLEDLGSLRQPLADAESLLDLPSARLVTSRAGDASLPALPVPALSMDDALALLLRQPALKPLLDPGHADHSQAQLLCALLGRNPLAIRLAATYLERVAPNATLAAFLDMLEMLRPLPESGAAWDDPAEPLLRLHWAALPDEETRYLLQVASLLPANTIAPTERLGLLASVSSTALEGELSPLERALRRLQRLSLLESLAGGHARLHKRIRDFVAERTPAAFRTEVAFRVAATLGDMVSLAYQVEHRGIDAVLAHLSTGLTLSERGRGRHVHRQLSMLHQVLDAEAHNLRGWDSAALPGLPLQQVALRAGRMGLAELSRAAEERLARQRLPLLRLRWRTGNGEARAGHQGIVHALAITPDGQRAISASEDNTLRVWDLAGGGQELTLSGHGWAVNDVVITPDGRLAVSASADHTVKVWNLESGQLQRTLSGHKGWVLAAAITPDGRHVVSASGGFFAGCTLRFWDLESGRSLATLTGHEDDINALAVTPDGQRILSASADRTLKLWSLETGKEERTLAGHSNEISAVVVAPGGRQAVSAAKDGTLRVWDISTPLNAGPGEALLVLAGHTGDVNAVAVAADGQRIFSAGADRTLRAWRLSDGQPLAAIALDEPLHAVAVTPDGKTVIVGDALGNLGCFEYRV